jgi:transcriptional regulator with XRE-family HTH domain
VFVVDPVFGGGQSRLCKVCREPEWERPDAAFFCFQQKKGCVTAKRRVLTVGKIPNALRETIALNIRNCRLIKFPGRGGGKQCAEAFGVSPQQWSPWERGMRTPDEYRLSQIADFFGMTVEWMRSDHRPQQSAGIAPPKAESPVASSAGIAGADIQPPSLNSSAPGSPASFFWLAHHFVMSIETHGLRLDKQSLDYLAQCIKR